MIEYNVETCSQKWRYFPVKEQGEDLPIFSQDHGDHRVYYSPGFAAMVRKEKVSDFEASLQALAPSDQPVISSLLIEHAITAVRKIKELLQKPFVPVCLTIYPSNQCNLHCSYCFANSGVERSDPVDLNHVQAALGVVAWNCKAMQKPLTLVVHGGGEPTTKMHLVQDIIACADQVAKHENLHRFYYLATNGMLSIKNAQWLAQHFDLVGLSCDGPDRIQDKQRSHLRGIRSSELVRRTASIFRDAGIRFCVRVTLTPASFLYQEEIADYICRTLRPSEIHVEPLYAGGRAGEDTRIHAFRFEYIYREISTGTKNCAGICYPLAKRREPTRGNSWTLLQCTSRRAKSSTWWHRHSLLQDVNK